AADFGGGRAFDWIMRTDGDDSDIVGQFRNDKGDGHSVRCVSGRLPPRSPSVPADPTAALAGGRAG
ncbi:MAG: hypothetical protein LBH93_03705, partial [Chitinispirillales bacterium]|nr:hypothetical protein [Chitinispirillales bacterium]